MANSNYGELKTAMSNWLDRDDLTAQLPDFIEMAETDIHRGLRLGSLEIEPLRIRAMETSSDISVSLGIGALPTGYLSMRRAYLSADPIERLNFIAPFDYWSRSGSYTAGRPLGYTIEGDNILTLPTTDSAYTVKMLYYKAFTSLSDDADTNWLFANAPGVYLNMSLYEAFSYIGDEAKAMGFAARAAGTINALNSSDKFEVFSGSPMRATAEHAP